MSALDPSSPFLPLPDDICISSVHPTTTELVVSIACKRTYALCPCCGGRSERIHGQYGRTVADLPCGGRRVILALTVRKFVCPQISCSQKIFTERLTELVRSYARMTNRLRDALVALGLATSAQVSERVAPALGMHISAPTLIRRLREVICPPPVSVRILGVDDWSWKRGQTYGTLLVDLELRRPIELLPDRREETLTAWLLAHPEIEVISRDRGGEYAATAKKGAPQAQQIADRFHLLLNLREKLKELMARKQRLLPHVEAAPPKVRTCKARGGSRACASAPVKDAKSFRHMSPYPRATPSASVPISPKETPSQVSRSNRYARYEAVRMLHQQLVSEREIARRLHLSRNTVHKFLQAEAFPERSLPPYRGSILDPYKPYILERWKAGCWNGTQLLEEIKNLGYTGSGALFRTFLVQMRKQHQATGSTMALELSGEKRLVSVPDDPKPVPLPKRRMSPSRASWLYICQPEKLDEQQHQHTEQIRAAHHDLDIAYHLSQAFVSMLIEHRAQDLDDWLIQARQSGIRELKSFAQGIRRDYAAVCAAFTSQWSNGPVEAQVNCLKLQKRLMFGRANFDLLRLRVLRHA